MSAAAVASSPQKANSLKRPQSDGTPQNTSGGKSPDQSMKKARLNGEDSNGVKDIGKGGRWMVSKLEELERLYKTVVKAATIVLQYQAFAIRLGRDAQKLPVHLRRRINIAWGSYEASRRQVQTYMVSLKLQLMPTAADTRLSLQNDSAQQATTLSSRQFAIPVPLPPSTASLSVPVTGSTNQPLASPIPLSAATMLSFDHPPPSDSQQQSSAGPSAVPNDSKPFNFDMMQNSNQVGNNDNNNNGMFDLQGMTLGSNGMSEFAAMLQQSSQGFTLDGMMGNANTQSNQPQQAVDIQQPCAQNATTTDNNNTANDETDQLLAQLGAFVTDSTQQPPDTGTLDDPAAGGGMGDDDINALLASLGETDGQDFTNFDFGSSLDMTNVGEMAGLFNTSTTVDSDVKPEVPPEIQTQVKAEGAGLTTIPSLPDGQSQEVPIDLTASDPAPAVVQPVAPPVEPKKEEQATQSVIENNDFSAIDLDDFNFGDGDEVPEGMGMSGDEFDRLLAGAFND